MKPTILKVNCFDCHAVVDGALWEIKNGVSQSFYQVSIKDQRYTFSDGGSGSFEVYLCKACNVARAGRAPTLQDMKRQRNIPLDTLIDFYREEGEDREDAAAKLIAAFKEGPEQVKALITRNPEKKKYLEEHGWFDP